MQILLNSFLGKPLVAVAIIITSPAFFILSFKDQGHVS